MKQNSQTTERIALTLSLALASTVVTAGCEKKPTPPPPPVASAPPEPPPPPAELDAARLAIFMPPLPAAFESKDNPSSEAKENLGRMLYFETRLSKNHDVSCNSCHDLATYGVDNKKVSPGHKKQDGKRNSPTVYNAAGHFVQFWDGRAKDVEEQAKGPILNPVEMAMPGEKQVLATLSSIPEYTAAFKAAFPADKDPLTWDNLAKAIAAFERKLVTPAPFDKYLAGDKTALTADQKAGLVKFVETGCIACHIGNQLGGTMYQKLGLIKPWPNTSDPGKFEATKQEADRMFFKVPGLRNVDKTQPYYHDGSVATLEESVKLMAEYQLAKQLSDADVKSIVTFLGSLTGPLPAAYIKPPELPKSTKKTPKPDPA